jgi:hypothetical protein
VMLRVERRVIRALVLLLVSEAGWGVGGTGGMMEVRVRLVAGIVLWN